MNDALNMGDWPLAASRDYLRILARLQLGSKLQCKLDASDIVQQTILLAHSRRHQFSGKTEAEWLGWLRAILGNVLGTVVREFETAARNINRELSLDVELDQSSARLEHILAADQSSPSGSVVRAEELFQLAQAITSLPDDQRSAVELHHLRGLTLAQTAEQLDRTRASVVGLLFRAMKRLRELLGDEKPSK